jgi:hypothetical protein
MLSKTAFSAETAHGIGLTREPREAGVQADDAACRHANKKIADKALTKEGTHDIKFRSAP